MIAAICFRREGRETKVWSCALSRSFSSSIANHFLQIIAVIRRPDRARRVLGRRGKAVARLFAIKVFRARDSWKHSGETSFQKAVTHEGRDGRCRSVAAYLSTSHPTLYDQVEVACCCLWIGAHWLKAALTGCAHGLDRMVCLVA